MTTPKFDSGKTDSGLALRTATRPRIAVVGVSALFPGSLDATGFWKDILAGTDLITDVPASHWLIEDYYDPDPSVPDKTYAKRGAFIPDLDFDAMGWGVPPNIVQETDTSQLLALIVAQKVLEDAGRGNGSNAEVLDRSRTSVILGVTSGQELLGSMVSRLQRPIWAKSLRDAGMPENEVEDVCERIASHYTPWKESTFPGLLGNVVAGRIANRLDLGGTNCVTDAACASTFSALAMAVHELQLGDSDMVITGGVDTMNDIFMFMCFSKTPALSRTGDCRPFSDQADGTMLSEGIGMVALKRLEDAEREGDRIYCVVEGVGASSDGRAKSVYAPRPEGQGVALGRAYELAGYGPDTVELLEAHGTGTVAGDAAEFSGLRSAFESSGREDLQWCSLGSVKSQIGHAKAAAGAAGLFKGVMALHHKVLPPTCKIDHPNPELELETSPFNLTGRARPWVRSSDHPRRASVSSFGFGGSNFHLALQEYRPESTDSDKSAKNVARRLRALGAELVVLGGASGTEIAAEAQALAETCDSAGQLQWMAHETQVRFDATAPARLALVATDEQDLRAKLEQTAATLKKSPSEPFSTPKGIHFGLGAREGEVAFVFPGQGSQYLDMGAALAMHFDTALEPWDAAAGRDWDASVRLHEVVFPRTDYADGAFEAQTARLTATEWAQPAIGCASLSMLGLLGDLGLEADCLGGHSYGEVTALCAAGVLSREDFMEVSRKRGELMAEAASTAPTPGSMLAVSRSLDEVRTLLDVWKTSAVVANHNGPTQVVLSGTTAALEDVAQRLSNEGIESHALSVATAFHSSHVAAASGAFGEYLETVEFRAPASDVYSNTSGAAHESTPAAIREALARQLACPVRFVDMIEAMYETGARTFVEVGPGSVLTGLVKKILEDRPHAALNLDRKGKDGIQSLLGAVASLVAGGHALRLEALWNGYATPENPADRIVPKLTIALNGSNYAKPYPPPGGAAELPQPNAHRTEAPAASPSTEPAPTAAPTPAAPQPFSLPQVASAPAPAAPAPVMSPVASDGWSTPYQEAQRQTAEAHTAYMQAMAQSHSAFLQTVERSFQAMGPVMGAQAAHAPLIQPQPVVAPMPAMAPPPTPTAAPGQTSQAPLPVPAPAAVPTSVPTSEPTPVPTPEPTSAAPSIDLHGLMLSVVAEKTGYPTEMLSMEMELEGDLGIDSIKRVEILSSVQDQAPGIPEVDTTVMAKLQTLGQIVDHMNGLVGGSAGAAPDPVARSIPSVPAIDLHGLMLSVVAEKTGYPTEMLSMEMELEGDLGIDSIKRVEILSSVQDQAPGIPEVDASAMAKLQTLGQIVDYMNGLSKPAGEDAPATAPLPTVSAEAPARGTASSEKVPPELGRFVLEAVERPPIGMSPDGLRADGRIVVTPDGTELADGLAAELASRGLRAEVVDTVPADAHGVIFLGGLRPVESEDEAIAINREAFEVARAASRSTDLGLFVTVQDTGGRFGLIGRNEQSQFDPTRAWIAGCAGLARTVAQEWPRTSVKAVDLERAGREEGPLAAILAEELLRGGPDLDVGLPAGGPRLGLRSVTMEVEKGEPALSRGDVVVASGGARGVTAATLVALGSEIPLCFVMLGRTVLEDEPDCCHGVEDDAGLKRALLGEAMAAGEKPTPAELGGKVSRIMAGREIRSTLADLEAAGSEARYETVDVTDAAAVSALIGRVRADCGPVAALVHGAGVIADKLVAEKSPEQFDRVFDTKVEGLRALLAATSSEPLKVLCLFSSVAARCGNLGQCDYAMANEILNKVAQAEARARQGRCLVRSLGWGPWAGGMVNPQLRARFTEMGVPLIPLQVGSRMLVDELASRVPDDVELVLGGEPRSQALLPEGERRSRDLGSEAGEARGVGLRQQPGSNGHGASGHGADRYGDADSGAEAQSRGVG